MDTWFLLTWIVENLTQQDRITTFETITLIVSWLAICISIYTYHRTRQDNKALLKQNKELSIMPEHIHKVSFNVINDKDEKYELLIWREDKSRKRWLYDIPWNVVDESFNHTIIRDIWDMECQCWWFDTKKQTITYSLKKAKWWPFKIID